MISVDVFLGYLSKGEIPPSAPIGTTVGGYDSVHYEIDLIEARKISINKYGMFPIVTKPFAAMLAEWIGSRTVLEIMSGGGWLSKALSDCGVNIIATDNMSWPFHDNAKYVYPVENISAIDAIYKYSNRDMLLVSWPYMDADIDDAAKEWGAKPIIYIGEDSGGCTATDYFLDNFMGDEFPNIQLFCYPGIHDRVMIGYFVGK